MFTRCPHCQTVHPLNASLLAHARGQVRCGACGQSMDALACLFDHWPDSDTPPPASHPDAGPPLLGSPEMAESIEPATEFPPEPAPAGAGKNRRLQNAWFAALAFLLLATLFNVGWTFRDPLLANPGIRSLLAGLGLVEPAEEPPFRDVAQLHLVSRDLHRHPTRAGLLALSITFVNRANQAQPYPRIELILRDAANQPLARRVFSPAEYLSHTAGPTNRLAPNVHVPVLLEFTDPGASATGFEINFL